MSELWVPSTTDMPDPTNLFDMMELFQEEIDNQRTREARLQTAIMAAKSLAHTLRTQSFEDKSISLVTDFAIVDSIEEEGTGAVVRDIGIIGEIRDVNCISLGERLSLSVALALDIAYLFPPQDPSEGDMLLSTGNVPISKVRYIERTAA